MYNEFSGIMDIPLVQEKIDYIKSKMGEFFQLPFKIRKLMDKNARLQLIAARKGRSQENIILQANSNSLNSLKILYDKTETKVKKIMEMFKTAGFGLLPLALMVGAIAVTTTMVYLFKRVQFEERILNSVEKKLITSGEAERMFGKKPLVSLGVGAGVVAVGGVLALMSLKRKS